MSLTFRKLQLNDYSKGIMNILGQLSNVGIVTQEMFQTQFDKFSRDPNYHFVVGERDGKIVSSASLLIEDKFLHSCGKCAHIDNVAVDKPERGCGIGKQMIHYMIDLAKKENCYKVILNCTDENVGFYQKCGLKRTENEMRFSILE